MAHFHSPRIVTNGLVLALDAGNTKSYPGSGTTWFDRSGNGNNGTLVNGPTFSSGNGGSLNFDGVNDVIVGPSSNDITGNGLQNMTLSVWLKFTTTSIGYVANIKRTNSASTLFGLNVNYNNAGSNLAGSMGFLYRNNSNLDHIWITHADNYNNGVWHNLTAVIGPSTTNYLYINGNLKNSDGGGIESVTGNSGEFTLGSFANGIAPFFAGNISNAVFYNKSLTAAEVLQNYNATKGRFGL